MCYKVFLDVGLFDTFKIPINEFINYFHALEMGYRDKPCKFQFNTSSMIHYHVEYTFLQPFPVFPLLKAGRWEHRESTCLLCGPAYIVGRISLVRLGLVK